MSSLIRHYAEVTEFVNQREFECLIAELKKRCNPLPPDTDVWEDNYRGQGWTDEGAFTLCLWEQAMGPFYGLVPERQGPLSEAEELNQVLNRPISSLIDEIFGKTPFIDPKSPQEIDEGLEMLREAMQRRLQKTAPGEDIPFELPKDLEELLQVTDYIGGAGIPSQNSDTYLFAGIDGLRNRIGSHETWEQFFGWGRTFKRHGVEALTAFRIGGCIQYRQIYYVLCRDSTEGHVANGPVSWKIFDRDDVERRLYENLRDFLGHEIVHMEQVPEEVMLFSDRYP